MKDLVGQFLGQEITRRQFTQSLAALGITTAGVKSVVQAAEAMAEVLGVFAQDHQVLFFTCSSRTRDLLAAAPNAALHEIGAR